MQAEDVVAVLRACGETTRLRLLSLLSQSELTVKDLTGILGQSQPRISRHLKLLTEAAIIERYPEGSWVYYRLGEGSSARIARDALLHVNQADPIVAADFDRLAALRRAKATEAADYFAGRAETWDAERNLHVPETDVEAAMRAMVGNGPLQSFLDLGTGTGRLLEVFADCYERGIGIDASGDMLTVARANLERAGITNAQVRQGDIYALPVTPGQADLTVVHQVLHYLEEPARAIAEAARTLRPGGRLLLVDFAPHDLEFLREKHAHRRLGFAQEQMQRWLEDAGLELNAYNQLSPQRAETDKLSVGLWLAKDPRILTDLPVGTENRELA
ncbi:ArsR/SmtB family transcription factor [Polycladidibacter hongkongensis]|uniref:ArsR/SmtB family transcription factor n=1 Tax=Polycladidibacter hongkongensis TaxID=1647556 RepID=UPI00082DEF3B|nr:metalloregulator ArsR/SmtB family transcription factor [Pseudovibrio hongkongensis]